MHGTRTAEPETQRLRAALDAAGDAVVVAGPDGDVQHVNAAALRVTGLCPDAVLGRNLLDLAREAGAHPDELDAIRAALDGQPVTYEARRERRTVTVRATPLPGGGATFVSQSVAAYREDDHRAARARLIASASRALVNPGNLSAALEALADLLVPAWADACACVIAQPGGGLDVIALRHEDPRAGEAVRAMMPRNVDEARAGGLMAQAVALRMPVIVDDLSTLPDDIGVQIAALELGSVTLAPLFAQEELLGFVALATAIDNEHPLRADDLDLLSTLSDRAAQGVQAVRLREATRTAESRFRAAFDHAPIGIALSLPAADGTLRFVEVNPAFCIIAGYARESLVGRPMDEFTHPEDRPGERRRADWLLGRKADEVSGEKRMVGPDGDVRWVLARSAPLEDGTIVTQIQDVTERRRFESELERLASHDTLTGVLNRRRLEEAVEGALAHVRRHGDSAAVLTVDIDNFKHVNDTYGHAVGDAVLHAVAQALEARLRETDRLGRLGGDEFGVVLSRTNPGDARQVAEELVEAIRDVRVGVGHRDVRVTASVGLRTLEGAESRTAGDLLSEADMAMYDAKERGRDRLSVINPGDLQPARVRERMRWSERIRDGLESGTGFVLFEQPIMRLRDDVVDRSELLVRMTDEQGAIVAPAQFLGVAERYGQIQALDRWVVRRAIALLTERSAVGHHNAIEVNLSGDSLSDPSVVDFIVAEIAAAGVDPARLIFEVTETSAIGNLDKARGLAERLTGLGCGFALDDFGAGFGSFAYLKHLPLSIIKIDGQFIRNLWDSRTDQVTVRAMVDMARGLGKETVAEFVEDEVTCELLKRFGVDRAQGYHIGRPALAEAVPAFALT